MFLYFGIRRFLWQEREVSNNTGVVLQVSELPEFKAEIEADILSLKTAGFKTKVDLSTKKGKQWSSDGSFRQVEGTTVWVYQHGAQVRCSDATHDNFNRVIKIIEEKDVFLKECQCEKHLKLEPFFRDNESLKIFYKSVKVQSPEIQSFMTQQLRDVTEYLQNIMIDIPSDSPFYCGAQSHLLGTQYIENIWTQRLCTCIKFYHPGIDVYYTAEQGPNFMYRQSILSGLPADDNLITCYPFVGSPDIRIKKRQVILADKGVETLSLPQSLDSSSEENIMEFSQQTEVTKYISIQKLGELFGTVHITLVQKVLRMLLLKKKLERFKRKTLVQTQGLYINKLSGGRLVTVKIPIVHIEHLSASATIINVKRYPFEPLTSSVLCCYLKDMLD